MSLLFNHKKHLSKTFTNSYRPQISQNKHKSTFQAQKEVWNILNYRYNVHTFDL